jgi:hypothetical protein
MNLVSLVNFAMGIWPYLLGVLALSVGLWRLDAGLDYHIEQARNYGK